MCTKTVPSAISDSDSFELVNDFESNFSESDMGSIHESESMHLSFPDPNGHESITGDEESLCHSESHTSAQNLDSDAKTESSEKDTDVTPKASVQLLIPEPEAQNESLKDDRIKIWLKCQSIAKSPTKTGPTMPAIPTVVPVACSEPAKVSKGYNYSQDALKLKISLIWLLCAIGINFVVYVFSNYASTPLPPTSQVPKKFIDEIRFKKTPLRCGLTSLFPVQCGCFMEKFNQNTQTVSPNKTESPVILNSSKDAQLDPTKMSFEEQFLAAAAIINTRQNHFLHFPYPFLGEMKQASATVVKRAADGYSRLRRVASTLYHKQVAKIQNSLPT